MPPTIEQLRTSLALLGLSDKGLKKTLLRRIRCHNKLPLKSIDASPCASPILYCCFDVEATCDADSKNFPHEIIEFPIILLDSLGEKIDEFHSYVRPLVNPILTPYCTALTGISQSSVDSAPIFTTVLDDFEDWLSQYTEYPFKNIHFVTDGPWDIRDFIVKQCRFSEIRKPIYMKTYIDLRKSYVYHYKRPRCNLLQMLQGLGMEFEGRPHSGIDDARNVARIWRQMLKDGYCVKI